MMLLPLATGRVSLEFAPSELDGVLAALGGGQPLSRERQALYDDIVARGELFILQNEWDDPCLISLTETGDAMLRAIASAKRRVRRWRDSDDREPG